MRKLLTKKNICVSALVTVVLMPILVGYAHAQAIEVIAEQATDSFNKAFAYALNSFCFIVGGFMLAAGVMSLYQKHRNNNAGTSAAYIAGAFICGGFLIGFPYLVRTASFSFWGAATTVTGEQRMMQFDK